MKFVKTDHLKAGMRLAKPIYNKNGVLLYDRGSALTEPGIVSARNFSLVGIYILEPAEPLPPLSREDLEFEQLQTVYIFQLRECLELISKRKKIEPLPKLLNNILEHYGTLDHRVNFNQNLRSSEDFMYKHAISTAILVSMISSRMHYDFRQQITLASAALLHDIGYSHVPKNILDKGTDMLSSSDRDVIQHSLERGIEPLGMYRSDFEFFPPFESLWNTKMEYDGSRLVIAGFAQIYKDKNGELTYTARYDNSYFVCAVSEDGILYFGAFESDLDKANLRDDGLNEEWDDFYGISRNYSFNVGTWDNDAMTIKK